MARTYGELRWEAVKPPRWCVVAEPHVVARMARVFPDADVRGRSVRLTHSPETARELLWFFERYPVAMSKADRASLRGAARGHVERLSAYEALVAGAREPREFALAIPPRDYQRRTAEAALTLGGILCGDDPGLGKTVTGLATLSDPSARPALVVTLASLTSQWAAEAQRFLPGAAVHVLKKGTPYDMTRGGKDPAPDIVVTNYHKIAGWEATLTGWVRGVVFDEIGELRHGGTAKYRAAAAIASAARVRLGLSATPVYGMGGEIFNVLEVLRPGALGTEAEFIRGWCKKGYSGAPARVRDPKALGSALRDLGLVLRHTRTQVGRELPPLSRNVHTVDADLPALERVESRATELALILLRQGGLNPAQRLQAAEELSHLLRQATGIAKARYVADFVRLLVESGERVLLFGHHHAVYDLWGEHLSDPARGGDLKPAFYTGRETPAQKAAAAARFVAGDTPVLVMANRAGFGLDGLQKVCRTVVIGELDWAPAVHEQGIARAARDGQEHPVQAWYLVSGAGSDPVLAEVLGLKRAQAEPLRDPDVPLSEDLAVDANYVARLAEAFLGRKAAGAGSGVETA
jgi:SNF2 family DNA or RNA helicase